MALTMEDLAAQIVALTDQLNLLRSQVGGGSGSFGGRDERGGKGLLFDRKLFEPEKFERIGTWKEWSEDFVDWIEQSEPKLAEMLNFAATPRTRSLRWGPLMS